MGEKECCRPGCCPDPNPHPVLLCALRQKEVINMRTCRSMGCISDLEIDCCTGCILALVVPGPGRLCWFLGRDFEFFIPWRCVVQIGADIILVDVEEEKCKKRCG